VSLSHQGRPCGCFSCLGKSRGRRRKSADAGPLLRCTLYALRDQHTPSGMQCGEKAAFLRTGRSGALRATVPHRCNPDRNAEFDSQRLGCSELWSEHHDAQDSNRFGRRDDCDSQFDVDYVGPSRRGHPRCCELWR
jgi:hypothetical protein